MHIVLHGCSYHFGCLSEADRRTTTLLIFNQFLTSIAESGLTIPRQMVEDGISVITDSLSITRLYFAEVILILESDERFPSDLILYAISAQIGTVWDEFVRSIDRGGFVGIRLSCGIRQFSWSSEGRILPHRNDTYLVN